ncbi:MAG: hypothetical protein IJK89_03215 [Clostridia bacterium]|nr:hypothetical protein [Clostridia bacterium]
MKYQIDKKLHNDFNVFEKNKLTPRAYAVPYADAEKLKKVSAIEERYSSDMVKVLSGDWDFKFYSSISNVPDRLDSIKVKFSPVTVPSDWQRLGFEEPVYLNCPYQFKTLAPEIPEDMPVGIYRKIFELDTIADREIISFLGVANNLSLYVNGKFVGYSEGSHNTAEFDITSLLNEGANELLAVSFKWCNGSFLEAQDMFRDNGIFRDVLLYEYGKTFLYDYDVKTEKQKDGYSLTILPVLGDCKDAEVTAELYDASGKLIKKVQGKGESALAFGVLDVTEWNAELPVLYDLYITVNGDDGSMTVKNRTGFKTIEIKDAVFYFNGQPVKCKGVNHHDTDLYKGYAMSPTDMERDIQLMKSLNVNTVRTSHYPPDPFFITLADMYGMYIVDEADIETHGCGEMAGDISYISKDPAWATHYVDRVKRMYYRDRNHPSLIMWSLGNESGGYKCQDKCCQFLKSTGTTIPVHYESVIHTRRFHYDVISEMYTSTEEIEAMMKGKRIRDGKVCREYSRFPFYLCEYCHAMGVGPGNLEEYWDLFYEWDNSMGGCIWEWADHTVYHPDGDKKYKYRFTYGGDHGEKQHDGHFCVDGLMYADRSLHTGAKEMQVVYRPIRASQAGEKLYCFENTNRFRSSDYIAVEWVLLENGAEIERGTADLSLPPMGAECVKIDHKDYDPDKDCHINFIYTDKTDGHVIAVEQVTLNDVPYEYDIEIGEKIAVESECGKIKILFENGSAVFDAATGDMISYLVNGKEIINVVPKEAIGFLPNLSRAWIDNDARMLETWQKCGIDNLKKSLRTFDAHIEDGEILVEAVYDLKSNRKTKYRFTISYLFSSLGAMETKASLTVVGEDACEDLPRFGVTVELDKSFDHVVYYGRGESENMPDFKAQAPVGIYSADVDEMYEPYVYPQESGMHCDVKWIELSDHDNNLLRIYADDTLAFSVHHFTQKMIDKAQHQEDIKKADTTFLTLDGYVRGIGSSSCGPDTRAEYRLNALEGYSFGFTVIPLKG